MELLLQRTDQNSRRTFGKLAVDGAPFCVTLERPKDDPQYPCIPAGRYRIILYDSPRFKRQVPYLMNVPMRADIEIHPGNSVLDTHGCILVGSKQMQGTDLIVDSRLTFKPLIDAIRNAIADIQEVWITVLDVAANL